jgi:hypothetical protein
MPEKGVQIFAGLQIERERFEKEGPKEMREAGASVEDM